MSTELKVVDSSALSESERAELDSNIDALISAHKNNRQEINRLVFESVAAMTTGEDYERQLANKKGLRRFIGGITGSNKELQDKINSSRAAAQYASQQTLQRLAEQNLMSFDLISAVNNKLNASIASIEGEINEIYAALLTFFKQNRSDILQLESRVERLERNVNLLNWQNAIEYQMFQGIEYPDLSVVAKVVCLTRDFYDITKGEWTTSDLLLLKTAMNTIGLSPRDTIDYYGFIKSITYQQPLNQYLLSGKHVEQLPEPYLVPLLGMKKMELLDGEESFFVDIMADMLEEKGITVNRKNLRSTLTKKYLMQEAQINVDVQVNVYDLIIEMLFNLREAQEEGILGSGMGYANTDRMDHIGPIADELYEQGKQYEDNQDWTEAVRCYLAAAELGHAAAQCSLGDCYEFGDGVPEDMGKAIDLFVKAAEQGDADAQNELGNH